MPQDTAARSRGAHRFISIVQAADYLAVEHKTVRRMIAAGHLTGHRLPGSKLIRVDLNELDAAINANTNPDSEPASRPARTGDAHATPGGDPHLAALRAELASEGIAVSMTRLRHRWRDYQRDDRGLEFDAFVRAAEAGGLQP